MKTRTLLLLAVSCGLAILVAGSILLLRLDSDPDGAGPLSIGASAQAGDLTLTVDGAAEAAGVMRVTVTIGGVDDLDGIDGIRLVVPGTSLEVVDIGDADACQAITVADQRCTLSFDTSAVADQGEPTRILLLRRAGDQQSWTLT